MGEARKDALRVNPGVPGLKLEFHGVKVSSDAGLLAYRELGEVFGLTDMVACELRDNRTGKNTQHSVRALLRQSIYSRLAGYENTNDAERLCVDNILYGKIEHLLTRPVGRPPKRPIVQYHSFQYKAAS